MPVLPLSGPVITRTGSVTFGGVFEYWRELDGNPLYKFSVEVRGSYCGTSFKLGSAEGILDLIVAAAGGGGGGDIGVVAGGEGGGTAGGGLGAATAGAGGGGSTNGVEGGGGTGAGAETFF